MYFKLIVTVMCFVITFNKVLCMCVCMYVCMYVGLCMYVTIVRGIGPKGNNNY